ncbi:MAG: hypothetical protein ACRDQ5_04755 [Sciscionella sp.]
MNPPLVVMDIGDVLIRTVPMAHHRELARRSQLPSEHVVDRIENSGIVGAFERGELADADFVDAVRRLLAHPGLLANDVERAWNAVIADPDPVLVPVAARLAAQGRLLLASNTNPFHWRLVRARLAGVGVNAPAYLSFATGYAKPDLRFFTGLRTAAPQADGPVIYVDDRPENVQAACRRGFTGWIHRDSTATAVYLRNLPT